MPALSKSQLLEQIVRAVRLCGWEVHYASYPPTHPFHLIIHKDDQVEDVLVYIWNITHGGAHRAADEYRIQITGVMTIDILAGVKTLLLGYWDANDVFAGWDARSYTGQIGSSPSLQIREQYLLSAHVDEIVPCPKDNAEVAIAFAPESFVTYVRSLEELHSAGSATEQNVVIQIGKKQGQISNADIAPLPADRQKIMKVVAGYQRASDFRRRVLTAYSNTCAICGMQLDLVDAAHIIPVAHPVSNDNTNNGLCLCAMHHRAFDAGLIAILPDYRIVINQDKLGRLRANHLHGEEQRCLGNLRVQIRLPPDPAQQPGEQTIQKALEARDLNTAVLLPVTQLTFLP